MLFTSCLTAIKNHVIKYCTTIYESNGKTFWSLKIQMRFLINLNIKVFLHLVCLHIISLLSILHCLLIQLMKLIERTFNRKGSLYLVCNENRAFITSE